MRVVRNLGGELVGQLRRVLLHYAEDLYLVAALYGLRLLGLFAFVRKLYRSFLAGGLSDEGFGDLGADRL